MPDAKGNIKGTGWSQRKEVGWLHAFSGQGFDPKRAWKRCNNKVTTPREERCWKGEK